MGKKVFIAPGHGRRLDGGFDPGAVSGSFVEHELGIGVAGAASAALRRCGVDVLLEAAGSDHRQDPNFIGSTAAANRWGADYALEVHHNAGGGSGCEVLVNDQTSARNRQLAERMTDELARQLGLPRRRVIARGREYFTRETTMPACIPECAFVDSAADQQVMGQPDYSRRAGEAIAKSVCWFLGIRYVPPSSQVPPQEGDLSMADAQDILDVLGDLRHDLTVFGTTGLAQTTEKFAERQRDILKRLEAIQARLDAAGVPAGPVTLTGTVELHSTPPEG